MLRAGAAKLEGYKVAPPRRTRYELALSAALMALGVAYLIGTR